MGTQSAYIFKTMWPHSYQSRLPCVGSRQSQEKPPLHRFLQDPRWLAGSTEPTNKACKRNGAFGTTLGDTEVTSSFC